MTIFVDKSDILNKNPKEIVQCIATESECMMVPEDS